MGSKKPEIPGQHATQIAARRVRVHSTKWNDFLESARELVPEAWDVMRELLKDPDPNMRFKAAVHVMERAYGKPGTAKSK